MAVSAFTVANIKPSLNIDSAQRFILGSLDLPEPLGSFKLDNIFVPTLTTAAQTNFEIRNNTLSGYRFIQITSSTDTFGQLKLQSFVNASPTGTDILIFNSDGSVSFSSSVTIGTLVLSGNLNMNGFKVINAANPTNPQDYVTKAYGDANYTPGAITLTGAVTGSGTGSIATVLASTIATQTTDQTFTYNHTNSVGKLILKNLYTPGILSSTTDLRFINANNAGYIFSHFTDTATYSDTGALGFFARDSSATDYSFFTCSIVGGRSNLAIVADILFNRNFVFTYLSTLEVNTDINMNSVGKVINAVDPTNPQDYVTKAYGDANYIYTPGAITLTGAVTGSGTGSIATTLTPITASQVTNFNAAVQTNRLDQMALPAATLNINNQNLTNVNSIGFNTTTVGANRIYFQSGNNMSGGTLSTDPMFYQTFSNSSTHQFICGTGGAVTLNIQDNFAVIGSTLPSGASGFMRLSLWNDNFSSGYLVNENANYGMGIQSISAQTIYKFLIGNTSAAYAWFAGNASNSSSPYSTSANELMRLSGLGNLGIGTTTPNSLLQFINVFNNRIITLNELVNNAHQFYGFGINSLLMRYQVAATSASHVFYAASSATTSNEIFRIGGNGNVSINGAPNNSLLQFPTTLVNRIITLSETNNNQHQFYGFGINAQILRYQVDVTTSDHVFYAGTSTTTSNELFRVKGTGDAIVAGTLYGNRPCATVYFQSNATTTSVTANVFTKIGGTTTLGGAIAFTMPINNRVQYTGTPTINARIVVTVSASHNQVLGATIGISIAKNGTVIIPSAMYNYQARNNQLASIVSQTIVSMATNDYIEAFTTCSSNATISPTFLTITACAA